MKNLMILIIALFIACATYAQMGKPKSNTQKMKYAKEFLDVKDSKTNSNFFISSKPITNREYIIYLLWLQAVYSDYPSVLINAIPRTDILLTYDNEKSKSLSLLQNSINGLVEKDREYVFNSKYIDYPIVGLSWLQAMEFAKWLSDRYNEYILIKQKYIQLDLNQRNDDNFNTEAFLAGQYMGARDKNYKEIKWSDGLLIPAFRLPTFNEITQAKANLYFEIKPYKMFAFLEPWHFETRKNDTIILSFGDIDDRNFVKLIPQSNSNNIVKEELSLDEKIAKPAESIIELFEEIGIKHTEWNAENISQKDSLGRMPSYILGQNSKKEIISFRNISTLRNEKYLFAENKIFRVVVSAIINK